jgi:hypothetical protein
MLVSTQRPAAALTSSKSSTARPAPALRARTCGAPARPLATHPASARSPTRATRAARNLSLTRCAANPQPDTAPGSAPASTLSEEEDFDLLQTKVDALAKELAEKLAGTNIYIVGMMGTGKTTVGRLLAYCLSYCFFDTDAIIQEHHQAETVASIFSNMGEEYFRTSETEVCCRCYCSC